MTTGAPARGQLVGHALGQELRRLVGAHHVGERGRRVLVPRPPVLRDAEGPDRRGVDDALRSRLGGRGSARAACRPRWRGTARPGPAPTADSRRPRGTPSALPPPPRGPRRGRPGRPPRSRPRSPRGRAGRRPGRASTRTRWPPASSSRTRLAPTKPVPPVTRASIARVHAAHEDGRRHGGEGAPASRGRGRRRPDRARGRARRPRARRGERRPSADTTDKSAARQALVGAVGDRADDEAGQPAARGQRHDGRRLHVHRDRARARAERRLARRASATTASTVTRGPSATPGKRAAARACAAASRSSRPSPRSTVRGRTRSPQRSAGSSPPHTPAEITSGARRPSSKAWATAPRVGPPPRRSRPGGRRPARGAETAGRPARPARGGGPGRGSRAQLRRGSGDRSPCSPADAARAARSRSLRSSQAFQLLPAAVSLPVNRIVAMSA